MRAAYRRRPRKEAAAQALEFRAQRSDATARHATRSSATAGASGDYGRRARFGRRASRGKPFFPRHLHGSFADDGGHERMTP